MPKPTQPQRPAHGLVPHLRQARLAARLSQLALSTRLGVSQRHVSYVEGGRAKPSRELLVAWLQSVSAPLPLRNSIMLAAGYSPVFSEFAIDEPALAPAQRAIQSLLANHDPMPCYVLNAQWDLLASNDGGKWLASMLMPGLALLSSGNRINMLEVLSHPDGYTKHLTNLDEIGPKFLAHMSEEAALNPSIRPRVAKFAQLLEGRLGRRAATSAPANLSSPILTSRFATGAGDLALFSLFTTFGRPQDITLASIRVEHMFAADDQTRRVMEQQVPRSGR